MLGTNTLRKLFVGALLVVIAVSLVGWYTTRDRLPRKILIATGKPGGLYHEFGNKLAKAISERFYQSLIKNHQSFSGVG